MYETLQEFVDGLIEERGMSDMDSAELDDIRAEMYSQVEESVNAALESNLSDDNLRELESLRETADDDEIAQFFEKSIPEYDAIMQEEMQRFKDSYQI